MIIDKGDVLMTEGNKGERHTLQRYNKCRSLRQAQGPFPKKTLGDFDKLSHREFCIIRKCSELWSVHGRDLPKQS